MSEIDERLMDLGKRRSNLPASIAVMETHTHAQRINACLADLESNMMRLAACWDGELDPIGAFSQLPSSSAMLMMPRSGWRCATVTFQSSGSSARRRSTVSSTRRRLASGIAGRATISG